LQLTLKFRRENWVPVRKFNLKSSDLAPCALLRKKPCTQPSEMGPRVPIFWLPKSRILGRKTDTQIILEVYSRMPY